MAYITEAKAMFMVSLISFIVLAAVYVAVRIYIVVKQRNIIKKMRMTYHDEKNGEIL